MRKLVRQEPERHRSLFTDILFPGALAGWLGGVITVAVAMLISALLARGPWWPAELVGGVLRGLGSPSVRVLWGLVLHVGGAVILGVAFSFMLPRSGTAVTALLLGVGLGLVMHVVEPLVLPFASPALAKANPSMAMFALQLIFGATLGLVPRFRA